MTEFFLLNNTPAEVGRWFDELHVWRRRVEVHDELVEEVVGEAVLRVLGGAPLITPLVLVDPNQVVSLILHVLEELLTPKNFSNSYAIISKLSSADEVCTSLGSSSSPCRSAGRKGPTWGRWGQTGLSPRTAACRKISN